MCMCCVHICVCVTIGMGIFRACMICVSVFVDVLMCVVFVRELVCVVAVHVCHVHV